MYFFQKSGNNCFRQIFPAYKKRKGKDSQLVLELLMTNILY